MKNEHFESLQNILENGASNEELASFFYKASKSLEVYHRNGLYVTRFDPRYIKDTGDSVIYDKIDKITNRIVGNEVKSNVEALVSLMVGSYINYTDSLLPYAKLKEFYHDVKYSFPESDEEYFNASINNGQLMYYHTYVDKIKGFTSLSNNRIQVKSLATPEGKAMSEKENRNRQAAFANVLVFSSIVSLVTIVAVLTYIILK